jgi:hypothetical protein
LRRGISTIIIAFSTGSSFLSPVQASRGESPPPKAHLKLSKNRALDRLTLLLVDRLPSQEEREHWLSRGKSDLVQAAENLIAGPEFFHRQAMYWQTQLNNSPAWKWEGKLNSYELNLEAIPLENRARLLWYTAPSQSSSLARSCTGVWTLTSERGVALPCSCDESVDLLPFWDKSSSMRVCPAAVAENKCGKALEKCFPVDRRLSPRSSELEIDKDSAGGLALGRLLKDLNLANGRSLALAVINKQKWSQLPSLPLRTAMSRSSIALLNQWRTIAQDELSTVLPELLHFPENAEALEQIFTSQTLSVKRSYGYRALGIPSAETYLLSDPQTIHLTAHPLRLSHLGESVWNWNNHLVFSCAGPFVAQQQFTLPLPHPDKAKSASYFCSGCHMELDAQGSLAKTQEKNTSSQHPRENLKAECAVDHALRFLTGNNPSEFKSAVLKELGRKSFNVHGENLAGVIRDLALKLAGGPPP